MSSVSLDCYTFAFFSLHSLFSRVVECMPCECSVLTQSNESAMSSRQRGNSLDTALSAFSEASPWCSQRPRDMCGCVACAASLLHPPARPASALMNSELRQFAMNFRGIRGFLKFKSWRGERCEQFF